MSEFIKNTRLKKLVGSQIYTIHPETSSDQVLVGESTLTAKITAIEGSVTTALSDAKTYADEKIAALVNGSPEALDTLNELAAALGNDANFSTTVLNKIAEKANADHNHDDVYAAIDHIHDVATTVKNGFMSSEMVTKLNSVVANSARILLSATQPDDLTENDLWLEEIVSA